MKKAKYLIFDRLERNWFEKWQHEKDVYLIDTNKVFFCFIHIEMGLLGSAGWQYTKMKLFLLKYATFEGGFFYVFKSKKLLFVFFSLFSNIIVNEKNIIFGFKVYLLWSK